LTVKSSKNIFFLILVLATVTLRIIAAFLIVDFNDPQMWEFGMIARNMLNGEGFAFLALTKNVPSAFMPPGLPMLYYSIFKFFGDNYTGYLVILLINTLLSVISVILSYIFSKEFFNKNTAVLTSIYVCCSPILIFSSVNFNSIIIYQVLLLLVFIILNRINTRDLGKGLREGTILRSIIILGIALGLFLYFRAESLFFVLAFFLYFVFKKHFKNAFLIIIISAIMISPWTLRNYITFDKFIPVTSSFGYNFYTGHGDDSSTLVYKEKIGEISEDRFFEINQSEMAFKLAMEYINAHPAEELRESLNKIYSLWIIDIYRDSAKEPVYLIIWIPTLILFFLGTFFIIRNKSRSKSIASVYIYLLFSTLLTVVFFNIPRYQIQMSIVIIPISMYGLTELYNYFKTQNNSQ